MAAVLVYVALISLAAQLCLAGDIKLVGCIDHAVTLHCEDDDTISVDGVRLHELETSSQDDADSRCEVGGSDVEVSLTPTEQQMVTDWHAMCSDAEPGICVYSEFQCSGSTDCTVVASYRLISYTSNTVQLTEKSTVLLEYSCKAGGKKKGAMAAVLCIGLLIIVSAAVIIIKMMFRQKNEYTTFVNEMSRRPSVSSAISQSTGC